MKAEKVITRVGIVIACLMTLSIFYCNFVPSGIEMRNTYFTAVKKTDLNTSYESRKKVEDTARAMIASYKGDSLKWEQWKSSADTEEKSWANQAKMRANQTAITFNEYMLKNSFMWQQNMPRDISIKLEVL